MIYFAQASDGGPIKIGTTYNLDQRHPTLKRILGGSCQILGVMEGTYDVEREIHRRFESFRISGRTRELFEAATALIEFINANSS